MADYAIGSRTFVAAEDIAAFRRVKLSGASVVYSDQGEDFVGISETTATSGGVLTVGLLGGRTHKCTAAGAISAGAAVYGANDGKISTTAVGPKIGYALDAAGGNGDIIEIIVEKDAGETWSA